MSEIRHSLSPSNMSELTKLSINRQKQQLWMHDTEMKLLQNNDSQRQEILDAYAELIRSVAVANLVFDININETITVLKQQLIKVARERNPGWKNTKIGTATGIDRKLIPQIENNDNLESEASPLIKVLHRFKKTAEDEGTDSLKVKGSFLSLKSIVDQEFKGQHSYKSILEEGIEKNIFEHKDGVVKLLNHQIKYEQDPKVYLNYIGKQFQLYLQTAEFNFYEKDKNKKKTQNSNWSTNIPPKHHAEVETEIKEEIDNVKSKIFKILESWEDRAEKQDGIAKNQLGTFPKVGVSFNAFSARKHQEE